MKRILRLAVYASVFIADGDRVDAMAVFHHGPSLCSSPSWRMDTGRQGSGPDAPAAGDDCFHHLNTVFSIFVDCLPGHSFNTELLNA
ncbi:MAG: hypothetical protein MJY69_08980 [Bacteroidales bacterium]|nr:hypothetical protein [Bacteroidales bacterium]